MAPAPTSTKWTTEFDTARRQKLFQNPPKDCTAYPTLAAAVDPHIHSFNQIFAKGGHIDEAIKEIGTKVFLDGDPYAQPEDVGRRNRLSVKIMDVFLDKSVLPPTNKVSISNRNILPAECRERHVSYRGKLRARVHYRINNGDWLETVRELGQVPIMLKSNRCHLENMTPAQLYKAKEETEEFGGYFIVNGIEKIIRMLIVPRRNYPMAIQRPSYTNRGPGYSTLGVEIRSVRPDQTSQTNALHYLNDGNVNLRFSWRKAEYLIPVIMVLKALVETNDREIFEGIVGTADSEGLAEKQFVTDRVELLLRTYKVYGLHSRAMTRAYLGEKFRVVLQIPEDLSDEDAGTEFLRKIILPHLGAYNVKEQNDADKFRMLLFMVRKLYSLAEGECAVENPDAVQNQEVLLGGQLYGMIIKEKMDEWLNSIRFPLQEWGRKNEFKPFTSNDFQKDFLGKILKRAQGEDVGRAMEYFLSTGNLVSPTGLDLQQTAGFCVVAEKLNFYRFISHFRMVHRGAYFAQMKTTTVRKLLPESWGFLCPVHTPDGAPCGLLNHFAHKCKIATKGLDVSAIPQVVAQMGVSSKASASLDASVVVQLDGRILGFCSPKQAKVIADTLRYYKVEGTHNIPLELEIGYIPNSNGGQYPGIFMSSQSARMYREVKYLPLDKLDYVGPFEQPYMSIACTDPEVVSGDSTHVEFDPTNIFSIVANMTPFSDFNQSPRNMYQCQMGKQTMGTPATALRYRTDNKTYRLQTGQTPIVRPPLHNEYGFDNFPNGTNAVVAVISYTGYDMDDAMILNKSAHERGFGHGSIYKTKICDLAEGQRKSRSAKTMNRLFGFAPEGVVKASWRETLDDDGLPRVGTMLRSGDYLAAWHNVSYDQTQDDYINLDGQTQFFKYKEDELAFVEEVRVIGSETAADPCQKLSIKLRVPRSPVIGDKFSSRHGQKGVCSQKWPAIDMPFSESGIQPDIIINPHAFPSRMTIGMFVESLAGKAGALHGIAQDSTPFRFDEQNTAVDHFGHQLMKAGYNYYGNEPMYSGITGEELAADIYIGVVYYQRLRHMVNDKYQVRTTGPVNSYTGQPIKGRKKGGGIRVGEMERDSLLAHGTAFLLQDRLMNCSDYTKATLCRSCGSFLSTTPTVNEYQRKNSKVFQVRCRRCAKLADSAAPKTEVWSDGQGLRYQGGDDVTTVAVPGVLKYLDVELASMGIRLKFEVNP
ncbi:beta and beta-prime subunits of DNA dependent RNA-polymerase [Paraphaeosphaeria sporulosa]|uniref:DNA-directed RNA polymerase subunit beta n=1 Tax=Paraphaeosphaeria sporulosa TaxID=1460663 RepID=A0A177C8U7_9PLEO|nr:beta and beta-prime subunits of DNA dependent RNA-polymerase [Paraphaeosphaeria sporulosa]OAG03551.1 beta and beta-prime subunits of DNA dependent RNA-polymerase [Paraphaeosphaeria sporulosa]